MMASVFKSVRSLFVYSLFGRQKCPINRTLSGLFLQLILTLNEGKGSGEQIKSKASSNINRCNPLRKQE